MFKLLKNRTGQASISEYVVMFFLVAGMATGLSLFVRRSIQGRIRDANRFMALTVNEVYVGNLRVTPLTSQYEPYYLESNSIRSAEVDQTRSVIGPTLPRASSGIFIREDDDITRTSTESFTAPPVNAR